MTEFTNKLANMFSSLCGSSSLTSCYGISDLTKKRRHYETDDNVFLYIVRMKYPSLWATAMEENTRLCVPQGISLGSNITVDDIESHILRDTKLPGEYYTVNGMKVVIDGNELVAQDGFPQERRVRILTTEDIEDKNDNEQDDNDNNNEQECKTIHLMHISKPLIGGVDHTPDDITEMDSYTIMKLIAIMKSYPECEGIFREMDAFIDEIKFVGQTNVENFKRITPSLEAVIMCQWSKSVEAFEQSGIYESTMGNDLKSRHKLQLAQMVETYIMEGIHDTIYEWFSMKFGEKDLIIDCILSKMSHYTPLDIGIKPIFHVNLSKAVAELSKLKSYKTPLEKLLCMKRCSMLVFRTVHNTMRLYHSKVDVGDYQLATDDLVEELMYVILQAYPDVSSIMLEIRYINTYHFVNVSTSALGFYLNNFQVAIDFIISKLGQGSKLNEIGSEESKNTINDDGNTIGEGLDLTKEYIDNALLKIPPSITDIALVETVSDLIVDRGDTLTDIHQIFNKDLLDSMNTSSNNKKAKTGNKNNKNKKQQHIENDSDDSDGDEMKSSSNDSGTGGASEAMGAHHGETVMVFGDSAVRQNGDQAQTQTVQSASEIDGKLTTVKLKEAMCGQGYYAVVTEDGKLQTWGLAEGGRLGNGSDADVFFPIQNPVQVKALRADVITQVSCGSYHMMAITKTGELYGWGDNRSGQLGLGATSRGGTVAPIIDIPTRVQFFDGEGVTAVACGNLHTIALTNEKKVYSWGRAQNGRLGRIIEDELSIDQISPGVIDFDWNSKVNVGEITSSVSEEETKEEVYIKSIAAGWSHTMAVCSDGNVFTWGSGREGRLGHGSWIDEFYPQQIRAFASSQIQIIEAKGGYAHSIFLTNYGEVFSCGLNKFGQLGYKANDIEGAMIPQRIKKQIQGLKIVNISCGENHTAVRTVEGKVFTWGLNLGNQCAHGRGKETQMEPKEVGLLKGAKSISCGASHTMVIM